MGRELVLLEIANSVMRISLRCRAMQAAMQCYTSIFTLHENHCATRVVKLSTGELLNTISNHKNYNSFDCGCFKKLLFSTNSLARLSSDSSLSDSLLLDSSISQSHSNL